MSSQLHCTAPPPKPHPKRNQPFGIKICRLCLTLPVREPWPRNSAQRAHYTTLRKLHLNGKEEHRPTFGGGCAAPPKTSSSTYHYTAEGSSPRRDSILMDVVYHGIHHLVMSVGWTCLGGLALYFGVVVFL